MRADAMKNGDHTRGLTRRATLAALASASGAAPFAALAQQDAMGSLIAAARAEGELVFYTAATANVGKRIAEAFAAKYGIRTSFVRLSGLPLLQRYSSEAEAGSFAADAMLNASSMSGFSDFALTKGWITPLSRAEIPAIDTGEFPRSYVRANTAVTMISPWLICYNTERVNKASIPRTWPDVLDPRWRGQILLADPTTSDAYLDLWSMLMDRYGPQFLEALRKQVTRTYSGGPASIQALAAGEGALMLPTNQASMLETKDRGGPIDSVTPAFTTGVEMQVLLTARGKAKHYNAGRLFVHYILSREGNAVLNNDPGAVTMYDTSGLPRDYAPPPPNALDRKKEILALLGAR